MQCYLLYIQCISGARRRVDRYRARTVDGERLHARRIRPASRPTATVLVVTPIHTGN